MYESFYGIEQCPFGLAVNPDWLYQAPQHKEALAALSYGIATDKGLMVLCGEVGTGKTSILHATLQRLSDQYAEALQYVFVVNPRLNPEELLEYVLFEIGVPQIPSSKAHRLLLFSQSLLASKRDGKISVMLVDEAHCLTPEALEEIRLWTNFETPTAKLVHVVLAGQPELNTLLDRPDVRQVKQRIALRLTLTPLVAADVPLYIQHRWTKAGGSRPPFTIEAIEALTVLSKGYPRLLNVLCDNSLVLGFAAAEREVGPAQVFQAAADLALDLPSLHQPPTTRAALGLGQGTL